MINNEIQMYFFTHFIILYIYLVLGMMNFFFEDNEVLNLIILSLKVHDLSSYSCKEMEFCYHIIGISAAIYLYHNVSSYVKIMIFRAFLLFKKNK